LGGDLVGRDATQTQSLSEANKERRGYAEREESWQKMKAKEKRLSEVEGKESQLPVVVESFFLCLGFVGRAKQNKINRFWSILSQKVSDDHAVFTSPPPRKVLAFYVH